MLFVVLVKCNLSNKEFQCHKKQVKSIEGVDNVMKKYKGLTYCSSQLRHPRGGGWVSGGEGYSPIYAIYVCAAPKGRVFPPFWSENGYTLCSFWSGIGYVFQGNNGRIGTYLLFQFQMSKKERKIYEFEMDCKKCFLLLF